MPEQFTNHALEALARYKRRRLPHKHFFRFRGSSIKQDNWRYYFDCDVCDNPSEITAYRFWMHKHKTKFIGRVVIGGIEFILFRCTYPRCQQVYSATNDQFWLGFE